jgi:S1-C subfamily serine protease
MMKKLTFLLAMATLLGACASPAPEATPTPTSIPVPTDTPAPLATPTPSALTETSFIEPIRKQIFRELTFLREDGVEREEAYEEIARRWGITAAAVEMIAMEGATMGWLEPSPAHVPVSSTHRQAIERAQLATVAVGVIDGDRCRYAGSGGIIDPKGLIITNAHVVGTGDLYCVMYAKELEGETGWYYNARVIKQNSSMDLALLGIESHGDGSPVSDLSLVAVPLGDSSEVYTGDTIYVCGYPEVGGYNVTVTQGLVSGFEEDRTLIKTDTEISPGSSGGVAISEDGLLIGIPAFVEVDPWTAGRLGYLIAVNEVRRFLQ